MSGIRNVLTEEQGSKADGDVKNREEKGKIVTTVLMRIRKLRFLLRPLQIFPSTQKEGGQSSCKEIKAYPCQFALQIQGREARQVFPWPWRSAGEMPLWPSKLFCKVVLWPDLQKFSLQIKVSFYKAKQTQGTALKNPPIGNFPFLFWLMWHKSAQEEFGWNWNHHMVQGGCMDCHGLQLHLWLLPQQETPGTNPE